jgi:hypothetical protein
MDLTLLAHYGEKPPLVAGLVDRAQDTLSAALGDAFRPYALQQVHATIIGLEGTRIADSDRVVNMNYLQLRQQLKFIDLSKLTSLLQDRSLLPITARLAGYHDGASYPFTSRGQHPYLRSFSIQGEIAVAMGWPVDGDRYPFSLDRLRRALNEANVLHKYHASATDIDNDFFFVLGRVDRRGISETVLQSTQETMRSFLARETPLELNIGPEHLTIVAYTDPTIPEATSVLFSLEEVKQSPNDIIRLYRPTA